MYLEVLFIHVIILEQNWAGKSRHYSVPSPTAGKQLSNSNKGNS